MVQEVELYTFDEYENLTVIKKDGIIRFVILGCIAAYIPSGYKAEHIEFRGTSQKTFCEYIVNTYYDFALNGKCVLHILKTGNANICPYLFEEYPF